MLRSTQDVITGLVLLGLALILYFYLIPTWVGNNGSGAMSPRFFPILGTIIIGFGGITIAVGGQLKRSSEAQNCEGRQQTKNGMLRVLLIVAAMTGFILLFQWFGYLYAAPPFIASLMVVFGGRKLTTIILISTVATAFLFAVFSYGLNLPLA